ncbi:sulfatase-like hydrolase/transferase [Hyalangium sp.]|uniref:sulfatase-like hydrolase/transferase n=1 Tax=Hyalangium sp. TaxID=2028555 RepID=UPI002D4D2AD9|nr:sulfatase-like hydrolase/transferase [Hyalangium sp.]HYH95182.1 sulfatase-like hydrolase/transferase [Hyalangium sp.]
MTPRSPPELLRWSLLAALVGAGLGLGLFALETERLLRAGAVGVGIDVEGPYAALMNAIRPLLPSLLVRVAAVYAAGGAVLALVAGGLARAWGRKRLAWVVPHWLVLLALLAWDRAIARPALFDDLPALRAVLGWLVDHGAPWHPRLAAGLWLALPLGLLAWRWRSHRRTLGVAVGAAVAVGVLGAWVARPPTGGAKHPLVVLIGVDAFRPDRLRALGGTGAVAPHLDRFAEEGATLFTRAYTPIAQTEPAWRSMLTALWPHRTGVRYSLTAESRWIQAPTFAQRFTDADWRTVFATDCSRFHAEGPDSGFSTRLQPPRGAVNFLLEKLRYRGVGLFADNRLGAAWLPEFIDNRALAGIHDPVGYADRLAARLVSEASQGPTLFAFHATAAHFPGDPTYPFYRRFVAPSEPLERRLRMHFSPVVSGAAGGAGTWNRAGAEGLYDELLAQADAQVGQLFDALKRTGRYDDALILVFSDHGESFHADRPDLAGATSVHGARLSEEENRVLLTVKLPKGQRAPARVDTLVRLVDVGPTLLELSRLPSLPGDVDGVSLAPLLRGESFQPPPLYAETGFTHVSPEVFDGRHWPGAPRSFDTYRIRQDGVVEVDGVAHDAMVREKDRGAFDGQRWLVDRPRADGSVQRSCSGDCAETAVLSSWLDAVLTRAP